jgi:hypothetical protein
MQEIFHILFHQNIPIHKSSDNNHLRLDHLFSAAFFAISFRFSAVIDAARAFPPFDAPSFDNATA